MEWMFVEWEEMEGTERLPGSDRQQRHVDLTAYRRFDASTVTHNEDWIVVGF